MVGARGGLRTWVGGGGAQGEGGVRLRGVAGGGHGSGAPFTIAVTRVEDDSGATPTRLRKGSLYHCSNERGGLGQCRGRGLAGSLVQIQPQGWPCGGAEASQKAICEPM